MNIHIERCYPIVGGILISGTYLLFFRNHSFPESLSDLFSVSVTISAISIGFIATSKSILLTMEDRRIIQQIKDLGLYKTLINYIMSAIHFCFIFAILSALYLLIDFKQHFWWYNYSFAAWLFIGTSSLLSCYRVIHIFAKILRTES